MSWMFCGKMALRVSGLDVRGNENETRVYSNSYIDSGYVYGKGY